LMMGSPPAGGTIMRTWEGDIVFDTFKIPRRDLVRSEGSDKKRVLTDSQ